MRYREGATFHYGKLSLDGCLEALYNLNIKTGQARLYLVRGSATMTAFHLWVFFAMGRDERAGAFLARITSLRRSFENQV